MGQKVHPYGFRLGYTKPWKSRWFVERDYDKLLLEDVQLKNELKDKLNDFAVAPVQSSVQGPAVDDVLSALVNLGYQRPASEKAIEQAIAKDKLLAADFDGLFRGALKVIR